MNKFAMIYFFFGILTCIIGGYRAIKYNYETDELTSLSWFYVWWIFLPILLVKLTIRRIKK